MLAFVFRRFLEMIPTLVLVSIVVFTLIRAAPGDPAALIMGPQAARANPERLEALRRELGLDKPIPVQYAIWVREMATGNFGVSARNGQPVVELIGPKIPATVELIVAGALLGMIIAIPAAIISAVRRGSMIDRAISAVLAAGIAIPTFWLGLALLLVFSVRLGWLPASGFVPLFEDPVANLKRLVLPAVTLGVFFAATFARFLRSDLVEVLASDYIRTARSKGLFERQVIFGHAFRNALVPFLTVAGLEIGSAIGGVVIVEQVFGWSGIGWLTLRAVFNRDYALVQASALLITIAFVVINLLVDVSYGILNPRIRAQIEGE